ncbi:MAG: hypothetical protein R3F40_03055 [Candidatus Competibacteraceae bacterium]
MAFGYNSGPFAVTLNYEDGDLNTLYYGGGTNVYVTGAYTFGNNIIRAAYGYTDPDKGQVAYYTDGVRTGTFTQDTINTLCWATSTTSASGPVCGLNTPIATPIAT